MLDEIPPESFEHLSATELTERVRTQMAEALGEGEKELEPLEA